MQNETNIDRFVEGCLKNNLQSQEALYKSCYSEMMKICLRYSSDREEAASLYNQAMLKVFTNLHTYSNKGKLLPWIRTVVINACIDGARVKKTYNTGLTLTDDYGMEAHVDPEGLNNISAKEILAMVRGLPHNLRTVFNLYAVEGFTHEEIGRTMNIPAGTSKWYVSEARKLLKQQLEKHISPTKSFAR